MLYRYYLIWILLVIWALPLSADAQAPQLVIQTGHTDEVRAVAFSPDNRLLASGSADNTVKLWDTTAGIEVGTLRGHLGGVYSVAFSPDAKSLATAGADQIIRLWDVASGKELRSLIAQSGAIVSIAFSPDGRTLASASLDRTVYLWDVSTGQPRRTLRGHSREVLSVAFSPDGATLASGSNDHSVKLWEVATGKELATLIAHSAEVYSVAFSPDGRTLASGSADQTVKLWNTRDYTEAGTLLGHTGLVKSITFSPEGKTLMSGATDHTIRLWDMNTVKEKLKLAGASDISAIAISPDGKTVASANRDQTINLWETSTGTLRQTLKGHSVVINSIAFSGDNKLLAIGSRDATIKILSTVTGGELRTLEEKFGTVLSVVFSPDGRLLASGNSDQTIKLWDVTSGKLVRTLEGHTGLVRSVAFSPDGKVLGSASADHAVKLWDVGSGLELRTMVGHSASVNSLAFSPDGKRLATGSSDKTIKIWSVAAGTELRTLSGHSGIVTSVAFGPDGKVLASGSRDATINLWDVRTGQLLRTLVGHSYVTAVSFSADGQRLASGSFDQAVRFWDLATGELSTLNGHTGYVQSVAFSPNGKILASGGGDAVVRLWDVTSRKEVASVLPGDPGNWLVATPDGLFDGSPASWSQIHWSFGQNLLDVAPVETYFNEFYYPGLLAEILAGKPRPTPALISQKDRRLPRIELTAEPPTDQTAANSRRVKINIEISQAAPDKDHSTGSGALDLRLFRNGSLIKFWPGDLLKGKAKISLQSVVPIGPGENLFTAYAFNRDNIKSTDVSLTITGAESLRRSGTFYVLAIGISKYSNPQYNLTYAAKDAEAIAAELGKQQENLRLYSSVKVIPLLDNEATKANIMLALRRFAGEETALPGGASSLLSSIKPAQLEDAVVVFFAGHGTAQRPSFYLIPYDLAYKDARSALNRDGLQTILEHSISDRELEVAFEKINAGHLLLVLDAANSGQALESEEKRMGPMNSKGLAQLAYEKGMYILAASQSYQGDFESTRFQHGLLTFALLEGLTTDKADPDRDRQLTALEWLNYAVQRVPELHLRILKPQQLKHHPPAFRFSSGTIQDIDPEGRQTQRPRVFYRRELEPQPLILARY